MTRDELVKLAGSRATIHRLTGDDLRDVVALLETADRQARDRDSSRADDAYDLAAEIRSAAGTLTARADALSALLERRG